MTLTPELFVTLVADLGAIGVVLWLVYRTTTRTIPEMNEVHLASLEQARGDFKDMLVQQRGDFQRELEREREVHGQQVEAIIAALKDVKDQIPTADQILEMIDKAQVLT